MENTNTIEAQITTIEDAKKSILDQLPPSDYELDN